MKREQRFLTMIESHGSSEDSLKNQNSHHWVKETSMDWSQCPIGSLPYTRFPSLDLQPHDCQTITFQGILSV
jgi:hypothetical protein